MILSDGARRFAGLIFKAITRFEEWCLAGSILGIAILSIANVTTRTLFENSLAFAEEVSQFLIVIVTFIGLGYAVGKGRHIRMTAIYEQCNEGTRKALALVISATTAGLLFYLALLGFEYTLGTVHELGSVSPVLRLPLWCVYLFAPFGFALAGIQYTLAFFKNLTSPGVWLSFQTMDESRKAPPPDV